MAEGTRKQQQQQQQQQKFTGLLKTLRSNVEAAVKVGRSTLFLTIWL